MSETIITVAISFIGFLATNQWALPWIEKVIKDYKERKHKKDSETIEVVGELQAIEKENNSIYENQINFFVSQIDILQKQLQKKTDELVELNIQFDELRAQLIKIKEQLHIEKQKNIELLISHCNNSTCQYRNKI